MRCTNHWNFVVIIYIIIIYFKQLPFFGIETVPNRQKKKKKRLILLKFYFKKQNPIFLSTFTHGREFMNIISRKFNKGSIGNYLLFCTTRNRTENKESVRAVFAKETFLLHWTSQRHNQLFALCGKLIPSLSLYLLLVFLLCVLDDRLWWNARLCRLEWLHSVLHGSLEDLLDFFLIFVDYEFAATEPVAMLWTRKENSLIKTNHEDHEVKLSHSPGNSAGLSADIQLYKFYKYKSQAAGFEVHETAHSCICNCCAWLDHLHLLMLIPGNIFPPWSWLIYIFFFRTVE